MLRNPLRGAAVFLAFAGLLLSASAALAPFSLPWDDDAATVTDLSGLNQPIAVTSPRIAPTDDGHLARDGVRQRFLGVNIAADSAFPRLADADAVAARLAKFGVNSVRLHHLEAPWAARAVLLDYLTDANGNPIGRSRQLNPERLDRLHHFVARLADHGIYSDVNLLVSRQFFPDDGFPASISQLGWKEQQALSFFDPHLLELQQEHARNLLTAPNPYRGNTPLLTDPAVAFVEILNEYGYLQAWHEGTLDTLPTEFAATYRTHWNAWLASRYASTAAVLAAWGSIDQPLGAERLTNPTFAAGATGWNFERHDTAVATATATSDYTGGAPALRLDVTTAGAAGWHVQLNQANLPLTAGQIYTVSFAARADRALPFSAAVARAGPTDYNTIRPIADVTLGTAWQIFTSTFVAEADESSVRLNFNGFGAATGSVWIAAASFKTGGQAGLPPAGTSLEARNLPPLRHTGETHAPTAAQREDWFRYLLAADRAYFQTMYHFLHDTLGYPGVVFGTIAANSPPGNQAHLDAVDSHMYWQHPEFPGAPWDSLNWRIPNTSIVNSPDNHFGSLAAQRVQGRPFFCTEYQHPAPNSYGAEGAVALAAYAAFQDWDGLWFFAYGGGVDAWNRGYVSDYFSQDTDPAKMANLLIAAHLFRRADVAPAASALTVGFDAATQLDVTLHHGTAWQVGDGRHLGISANHALESRVQLDVDRPAGTVPPPPAASTRLSSDTGQLHWDRSTADGMITVDTARSKAVLGFPVGRAVELEGWTFTGGTTDLGWLTAGVTSLDERTLRDPSGLHALVVVTGREESTGLAWTDATHTSVGTGWGRAPMLVETVPLTLDVPYAASRVTAWALDATGRHTTAVPVTAQGDGARLNLGLSGTTLWYEVNVVSDPAGAAPAIALHPSAQVVPPGGTATLLVTATGAEPLSYHWSRNGVPLPGAQSARLTFGAVTSAAAGDYTVTVANAQGMVTSRPARLVITATPPPASGLINLSTRSTTGADANALIAGFVLSGSGEKSILIRAVGPALAEFGLPTFMPDPAFMLHRQTAAGPEPLIGNDDWDPANIGDAFTRAGAFGLPSGSADAALVLNLGAGIYSAPILDPTDARRIAIVELYDLANDPASPLQVRNLSSRGFVGTGNDVLIAGFAIPGPTPRRVLIRAIGPTLGRFGVTGVVADPTLEVVQNDAQNRPQRLAANDDWFRADNVAALRTVMQTLGAFALPADSRDAAALVELAPGPYSVIVRGAHDTTGIALVEIYAVD